MRHGGIFRNSWGAGPGAAAQRGPRRGRRPCAPGAAEHPRGRAARPIPAQPPAAPRCEGRGREEGAGARGRGRTRSPPEEGAAPALIGGGAAARGASRAAPAAAARPPAEPGDGGGGGRSSGSRCGVGGRACPRGGESAGGRGRWRSPLGDTTRGRAGVAVEPLVRALPGCWPLSAAMERRGCRAGAGLPLWSAGLGLGVRLGRGRPRPARGRAVVRARQRPAGSGRSRPRQSPAHAPSLSPGAGPAGEGAAMVPHPGQEPARG